MSSVVPPLQRGPTCDIAVAGGGAAVKRKPTCRDCGTEISRSSRGRCRPCSAAYLNADAELKLRRAEGIRRKFQEPEHREKMAKVARRNGSKYWLEHRPEAVERGKLLYQNFLSKPESRAKCAEAIRANSWKITEKYLSWCPPEYRDEYRTLQRRWRGAKRARAYIEGKMREDRAVKHPHFQSVVDHMRRLTAVVRLNNGNYRVGIAELTPGQLLERAEAKGYETPRWAA